MGYTDLANAVILLATKDYRAVLRGLLRHPDNRGYESDKRELERFFRSGWYRILADLDGEYLIQRIGDEEKARYEKHRREKNE